MKRKIICILLTVVLCVSLGAIVHAQAAEQPEMTVSQQFVDVLKKWEGFSATPYKDNGQYTFGYGCKCPSDQVKYYTENPLTEQQAEDLLKQALSSYEQSIREFASRYNLQLQQHQFDALVSFTYNCGGNWLSDRNGYLNTAVREMNTGAGLIYGLGLWSASAGRYILINRRMKEANMFINGEYDVVPSSYRYVYLDGGAGTTSYKIFCFDTNLKTPVNVEFKSVPTGIDANGKPFAYTLAGWYTKNGTKVTALDGSISRGQTLYARWADPSGKIVTSTDQTAPQEGFPKTATVVNVSSTVNARVEPTTASSKSGAIDAGSKVTVTEEVTGGTYSAGGVNSNIWCKLSDGRYVAKYYLRYAEESITGIRLVKQPAVTQYHQPVVSPKLEGSVLLVTYSDGSSEALTPKKNMVSGFSGSKQGKQTVTITYGGKTTTFSVTVLPPLLKITAQPTDAKALAGTNASITVKATGEGLKYTWYHKNAKASAFAKASGSGATYTTTVNAASNGRYVYCVVTDKHGNSVTSRIVTLSMASPAKIITQPVNTYAAKGKTVSVSVKALGDDLRYIWYHKNPGASGYARASFTGATYTTTMSDSTNGRYVYCIVTDGYGNSVRSNTVRLVQGNPLRLTAQLKNGYAPEGKVASVTVKATGEGLSYTWYHKNAGAAAYAKSSVTGPTYATKITSSSNGRYVYCVVRDRQGSTVTTNKVRLWRGNPAKLRSPLTNGYAPEGAIASVRVQASGDSITYTWYHKNAGASWYAKASATGATYSTKISSSTNGRYVYCVITDKYGNTVQTNPVRLWRGNPATITAQPKSTSVAEGKTASLTVKATGDGLTYTWYHKNAKASAFAKASTTSATYATKMTASSNGRLVYCIVRDKYGNTVRSNVAILTRK